jgi:F-type H+-transporting ATPase subunit a
MTSKINTYKKFSNICLSIVVLFLSFSVKLSASEPQEVEVVDSHISAATHETIKDPNAPVDIAAVAMEHISDSHFWHLWGEGHDAVSFPLPVILYSNTKGLQCFMSSKFNHGHDAYNGYFLSDEKIVSDDHTETVYDISITKNVAQLLFSALLLMWIFLSIASSYKKQGITSAPKGKQSFFEPLIVFVRDDIAKENIGHGYAKYVPYLLTVFFIILINNVIGMIPISANLTGNIAFTLVLSLGTFIITNINGNKGYWKHILLPKPFFLWLILMPIELAGIFIKPFALMLRLFANMAAGHIIVISLVGLIFVFKSIYMAPVSIAFTLFIDLLECLVALLQAYIFTMLTALFIGASTADHNHDGAHTSDDELEKAGH